MDGIFRENGNITRVFDLIGANKSDIFCYGEDWEAVADAEKTFNAYQNGLIIQLFYENISVHINCEVNVSDRKDILEKIKELDEGGRYFAHFIAHIIYIMADKINVITEEESLIAVFQKLRKDYYTDLSYYDITGKDIASSILCARAALIDIVNSEIIAIIRKMSNASEKYLELNSGEKKISSSGESFYKIDMYKLFGFTASFDSLYKNIQLVSKVLCAACKIDKLKKDPVLLKRVFNAYNVMECFLKAEEKLDKEKYDEIKELVAREETSSFVQDAALAMNKIAVSDISILTQSEIDLLRSSCDQLQESLRKLDKGNSRKSDVALQDVLKAVSCLQERVEMKSQEGNNADVQCKVRNAESSNSLSFVSGSVSKIYSSSESSSSVDM